MQSCSLNIVLHSAKDLKDVKHLGIMSPYAEVWISGDGMDETKHKTVIAKDDGCAPVWECSINFKNVSMKKTNILFINIEHYGKWTPDRKIGRVQVPFKDLLAGDAAGDKVSYRVMIPSGDHTQGEIILSHRFTGFVTPISTGNARPGPRKATKAAPKKATTTAPGKAMTAATGKPTTATNGKPTTAASGNATGAGAGIAATVALGIAGIVASSVIGEVTESFVSELINGGTDKEKEEVVEEEEEEEDEEEEEYEDDEEEDEEEEEYEDDEEEEEYEEEEDYDDDDEY